MGSDKKHKSSSRRNQRSTAPKSKDMISLGKEKLSVRRGSGKAEKVTADDLILEGLIQRAIAKQKYRDAEELYRRLDAEEASMPATQTKRPMAKRPTAKQLAECRAALGGIIRYLSARQSELIELGVARFEDGALAMDQELKRRIRRAPG